MRLTEELEFVFPRDRGARRFDDRVWHRRRRPADPVARNRARLAVLSHADRIAVIERALELNGQLLRERFAPH